MNPKILIIGIFAILVLISGCVKINIDQKVDSKGVLESIMDIDISQLAKNFPQGEGSATGDLCVQQKENFEKRATVISFDCNKTDKFKTKMVVKEQLPLKIFSIKTGLLSTKYTYNLGDYQKLLQQDVQPPPTGSGPGSGTLNQPSSLGEITEEQISSLALAGLEITYSVRMPGTIKSTTIGKIEGNKVVISLADFGKLNNPNTPSIIVSEETNILIPIIAGLAILFFLVVGGILVYFFIIKKKNMVKEEQPLKPVQPLEASQSFAPQPNPPQSIQPQVQEPLQSPVQSEQTPPQTPLQPKIIEKPLSAQQSPAMKVKQSFSQTTPKPNPEKKPLQALGKLENKSQNPPKEAEQKPLMAPVINPVETKKTENIFSFSKKQEPAQNVVGANVGQNQKPVLPEKPLQQPVPPKPSLQKPVSKETPLQPQQLPEQEPVAKENVPMQQKEPPLTVLSKEEENDVNSLLAVLEPEKEKFSREEITQVVLEKGYNKAVLNEILKRLYG